MAPRASHPIVRQWQRIIRQVRSEYSPATLRWLLRCGLVTGQKSKTSGFILPTVTLLLLMVSLVVGMLVYRTFTRTTQVIGQRQQRVLYNAATPAIEIGKSKLEYVFTQAGLPALPTDGDLAGELAGVGLYNLPVSRAGAQEVRIDLNRDGVLDNAWAYTTDADGDSTPETVAYSLLTRANSDDGTVTLSDADQAKADNLVVRNGPLIATRATNANCPDATALSPIAGWEREASNTSKLRKALQIHAVVLNDNGVAATLEMQQDRQTDYGNKWGAWFRYDLGNWPGSNFYWNGAMHTDGSFILSMGEGAASDQEHRLYLVSAPSSCVFEPDASVITMAGDDEADDTSGGFLGQFMVGRVSDDTVGGATLKIHTHSGSGYSDTPTVTSATDAVTGTTYKPSNIMMDAIPLFTAGKVESFSVDKKNRLAAAPSTRYRDSNWPTRAVVTSDRVFNDDTPTPFLDDTYRADDRWGPSPVYKYPGVNLSDDVADPDTGIQSGICFYTSDNVSTVAPINPVCGQIGTAIAATNTELLTNTVNEADLDEDGFGLDGYWERRARRYGVRVIVGQRLELGNANEWLYEDVDRDGVLDANEDRDAFPSNGHLDIDPLYPSGYKYSSPSAPSVLPATAMTETYRDEEKVDKSSMASRDNEIQQWRTLRDNLAAVQATAVYHYQSNNGEYPVACLATTTHPGTATVDQNSRTFTYDLDTNGDSNTNTSDNLNVNFFAGQGTNGLEFSPPFAGNPTAFEAQFNAVSSPLRISLSNLAYFAGDPEGAFPPTQDVAGGTIHPYPLLTMWGNYSELRRILESGTDYADLSIADQSTVHTATCTIGMLAYSLQNFDAVASQLENTEIDQSDPRIASQIDSIVDNINDNLATLGDPGGPWQSLGSRAEILLNGKAGTGQGSIGNLTWDTTNPTDCPASAYGSNQTELNAAIDRDQNGTPDFCISLENWAKGLVPGYNETPVTPKDDPTNPYPWDTDPTSAATRFIKDYGAEFYHSFTFEDWSNAQIPGDNTIAELSGVLNGTNQLDVEVTLLSSSFDPRRDRLWGFSPGTSNRDIFLSIDQDRIDFNPDRDPPPTLDYNWDENTGLLTPPTGTPTEVKQFKTGCNPLLFTDLFPSNNSINDAVQLGLIGIASVLCGEFDDAKFTFRVTTGSVIRYPSLYYLFPLAAHYHNGSFTADSLDGSEYSTVAAKADDEGIQIEEANQNVGDPYPIDSYITSSSVNGITAVKYRPVEDGLKSCATVACTVGTRDGIADHNGADDDLDTDSDNETINKFVTYLGVGPQTAASNWQTPVLSSGVTNTNFASNRHLIKVNGADWEPAIIDMAFYNPREMMSIRALSLDLNQMRRKALGNTACSWEDPDSDTDDSNGDCWLPLPTILEDNGGSTSSGAMIYAFREDAVREDAIARPIKAGVPAFDPNGQSTACDADTTVGTTDDDNWLAKWKTFATQTAAFSADTNTSFEYQDYLMNTSSSAPVDSPNNPCTGVSPKPVDFYPDPDRRPHGFLLRNGADLRRGNGSTWDTDGRGISFISDQPVFVLGDFNLHSTNGTVGGRIEEFTNTLTANWSNFYDRNNNSNTTDDPLNTNFARPATDTWRASEIISDMVYVLSDEFVPGYVEDGIRWNTGVSTRSSYGGLLVLKNNETGNATTEDSKVNTGRIWLREDGSGISAGTSTQPIKFTHRGFPLAFNNAASPYVTEYGIANLATQKFESITYSTDTANRRSRIPAPTGTNYVNAMIIGSIPPARAQQPYGQLGNHIHFIENWGENTAVLDFKGSLIQLNFATYSGPHDQDSWEPGSATNDSTVSYYLQPTRQWGFDVGLLYTPPGPVAQRLAVPSKVRSEFYREPSVDDAYIMNLRCAYKDTNDNDVLDTGEKVDSNRVDPNLTTTDCPDP